MINIYFYPVLLLTSIILLCIGIITCIKYAPIKIKILSSVILFLLLLRYLILAMFALSKSILLLYFLKPLFLVNYPAVVSASLIAAYVLMRSDKIKFNIIYIISAILLIFYSAMIWYIPANVEIAGTYGYTLYLINPDFLFLFLVFANVMFLSLGVNLLNKEFTDKFGASLMILSALVAIVETLMNFLGVRIFQESIAGDLFWIFTFIYSLGKLKSRD